MTTRTSFFLLAALVLSALRAPAAVAQYVIPEEDQPMNAEAANARLAVLQAMPLPADVGQMFEELRRVIDEKARRTRDDVVARHEIDSWEQIVELLEKLPGMASASPCQTDESRAKLVQTIALEKFNVGYIASIAMPIIIFNRDGNEVACNELVAWIGTRAADLARSERDALDKARSTNENDRKARAALVEELTKRERALNEALKAARQQSAPGNLSKNLLYFLMVLVVFCLAMMAIVRWYGASEQNQWIKSGQIVQAMTVIVLMFAILALGLSNVLMEQVLGTLLGGISGYVLSQGVGKSVAEDIRSSMERGTPAP